MPKLSMAGIAKRIGSTTGFVKRWVDHYERFNDVADNARTGRPPIYDEATKRRAAELIKEPGTRTAARVAGRLLEEGHRAASRSTVARILRSEGLKFLPLQKKPKLSEEHKRKRLAFAKKYLSVDWTGVAMSDSKYFYAQPTHSSPATRRWQLPADREVVEVVKHSAAVHVYMAVTAFGCTQLIIVTGGKQKPPHGKKFFDKTGKNYLRGVGEEEYRSCVLQKMLIDINNLFQPTPHALTWIFQQDGAPAHTAASTKQLLGRVLSPSRLMLDWPPNSPDLSWIENVWAWMDRKLRERPDCKNENELIQNLQEIWGSIPLTMLRNCAAGMKRRMEKVLEKKGEALNH
jgi:transposase